MTSVGRLCGTSLGLLATLCILVFPGFALGQAVPSTSVEEQVEAAKKKIEGDALQKAGARQSAADRAVEEQSQEDRTKMQSIRESIGATPGTTAVTTTSLTLKDIRRWLEDPEKRESALAALPQHGADGLKLLASWWRSNRRDRVATERAAETALAFAPSSERFFKDLIGNKVAESVVARAASLFEPTERGNALLVLAVERMKGDGAKSVALTTLSDRSHPKAVPFALKHMKRGNVVLRDASARVLGRSGDRTHIRVLVEQLQIEARAASDTNLQARMGVHWALSTLGGPDVVAPLIAALDRKDDQDSLVAALVRVGFPAVSPLTLVLKSGDSRRIPGSVAALLEMGELTAPYLADLLVSKTEPVRHAARDLLIAIRHESTPSDIEQLLRTTPIDDPSAVLSVLSHYDETLSGPVFTYAFTHPSADVRQAAVRLAGRADLSQFIQEFMKMAVMEREIPVQLEIVQQLHRMGAREASEVLADLAEDSPPVVRVAALKALGDLGRPLNVAAIAKSAQESSAVGVKDAARSAVTRISGLDAESMVAADWRSWAKDKEEELDGLKKARARTKMGSATALDGGSIPFRVAGDEGPTMVVLHGGPDGTSDYLLPFFDQLAEDRRVVTFNLRGRDGSMNARKWLEDYAPGSDVQDVEAVRRALHSRKVILVGHGFGALVALDYARTYPEHVARLVLMNVGVPSWEAWPQALGDVEHRLPEPWKSSMAGLRENQHLYTPQAFRWIAADLVASASLQNRSLVPIMRERLHTSADAYETVYKAWGQFDLRGALEDLSVTTLLVAADGDIFSKDAIPTMKKVAAKNKRVSFRVVTGARNYSFIEKRGQTFEVVERFLNGE